MSTEKWVMVSQDEKKWHPRKLLADIGEGMYCRYICATKDCEKTHTPWEHMRPANASELLPMIPDPEWAELAVKRCEEFPHRPDKHVETLHDAVDWAFVWYNTPEGCGVWEQVKDALRNGTPLPPVPQVEPEPEEPDPYAEAKSAFADGELQVKFFHGDWVDWAEKVGSVSPNWNSDPENYRRKPRTIKLPVCQKCSGLLEQAEGDFRTCSYCRATWKSHSVKWVTVQAVAV